MDNITVKMNNQTNKNIKLDNIEPITNIKVVRDEYKKKNKNNNNSENSSSSVSSVSSESSEYSESSESSEHIKQRKKKLIKKSKNNQNNQLNLNDYNSFSNPKKTRVPEPEYEQFSEYSSIEESNDGNNNESDDEEQLSFKEKQKMKQDLLIRIQALEKKGYEFTKKFTMTSDYSEMEFEYEKVKKFIETQGAIKFSRRCLMACVTGIEFLNKKFDPFSVQLDGWSENVMENVDDYDNVFERLHEKYAGRAEIAPEIELLLTLGGSAFMFHLTNSLLKTPSFESQFEQSIPQGPGNFMTSMLGTLSKNMKELNNQKKIPDNFQTKNENQQFPSPIDTRGPRKEMKGPSIDSSLFGNVNTYPSPPNPIINNDYSDRFSIESDSESESSGSLSVSSSESVKKKVTIRPALVKKKIATNKPKGFELDIL